MKFSSAIAASAMAATLATASPVEKRAVVTNYVHVTKYVYEQAHVYVDQDGNPVSTSYELVSSDVPVSTQVSQPPASTTGANGVVAAAASPSSTVEQTVEASAATPVTSHVHSTTLQTVAQASSTGSGSGQTFSGDATYYSPGLGACGETNTDSDFIAALNKDQWGNPSNPNDSPFCGKQVKINRGSKSVTVTITDKCPGCNYGDLDLSPAAFDQIADEAEGRVPITWEFL